MPLQNLEIIKVNIVVLTPSPLSSQEELTRLQNAVGGELQLAGGIFTEQGQGGRILTIPKDRIEIELGPARVVVNRAYVTDKADLVRVAEVYEHIFFEAKGPSISAYGANIDLVFDQSTGQTANEYLSAVLDQSLLEEVSGHRLVGGGARITLETSTGDRWALSLEPRFGDAATHKVFVSMNIHRSQIVLPTREDVQTLLESGYDELLGLVERLDKRLAG